MKITSTEDSRVRLFKQNVDKYSETEGEYPEEGDTLYLIDGVFFLIQNKGCNWNNIVSFRVYESSKTLKETITTFVEECRKDKTQFVIVNGRKWKNLFFHLKDELNVDIRGDDDEMILKLY